MSADEYRAAAIGLHDRLRRTVPGNLDRDARWWDRLLRDDEYTGKGAAPAPTCCTQSRTAR